MGGVVGSMWGASGPSSVLPRIDCYTLAFNSFVGYCSELSRLFGGCGSAGVRSGGRTCSQVPGIDREGLGARALSYMVALACNAVL